MKKRFNFLKLILVVVLILPLFLSWLSVDMFDNMATRNLFGTKYLESLFLSFRELSLTLVSTLLFAMIISILLGYLSVLSIGAGRCFSTILNSIESIP